MLERAPIYMMSVRVDWCARTNILKQRKKCLTEAYHDRHGKDVSKSRICTGKQTLFFACQWWHSINSYIYFTLASLRKTCQIITSYLLKTDICILQFISTAKWFEVFTLFDLLHQPVSQPQAQKLLWTVSQSVRQSAQANKQFYVIAINEIRKLNRQ